MTVGTIGGGPPHALIGGIVHRTKSASTHTGCRWTYCRVRYALERDIARENNNPQGVGTVEPVDCMICLGEMP